MRRQATVEVDKRVTFGDTNRQLNVMKRLIPVIAAFAIGGVAVGVVINTRSRQASDENEKNLKDQFTAEAREKKKAHEKKVSTQARAFSQRLINLKNALEAKGVDAQTVNNIVGNVHSGSLGAPKRIIAYLSELETTPPADRSKNADAHRIQVREVIRQFEELTLMGAVALPAISEFLAQGIDREFKENTDEIVSGNWSSGRTYHDPIFPPSLRIGLLNTVRHIGKRNSEALADAERVLLQVLGTTGRSIEVMYITRALEDLAPGVHKDSYLMATKDLLMAPIAEETRGTPVLDRQHRYRLFDILIRNKDETFVEEAKNQLLVERKQKQKIDGKEVEVMVTEIDRSVLNYLSGVLGARSMPILSNIYDSPELDDRQRSRIRVVAARYMGTNGDANTIVNGRIDESFQLLTTTGDNQKKDRARGMDNIRYYLGRLGEGRNVPAETLQQRQQFLVNLRGKTNDKEVMAMMDKVDKRLKDMSDPEKAKKLDSRFSVSNRKR